MVLLILLDDSLELRIAIGVVRSLLVIRIQDVVGYVFQLHLLGILLNVFLHEGVSISITATMGIAFDHDCI